MAYKYAATLLLLCAAAGSAAATRSILQASDATFTGYQCFYSSAKKACVSNVFYTMTMEPSSVPTDK